VEESQAGVVRVIRKLEEEGQIMIGRGDDDAFVA
jgi:flagellar motor switch protein FliG